jgi:hypothetical protein
VWGGGDVATHFRFDIIFLVVFIDRNKTSSSYSTTNLGQGGLFRSQESRRLIVSSVFVQVVIFLLDDNLEVVLGACSPPLDGCVGIDCVCMYKVFLLRVCDMEFF